MRSSISSSGSESKEAVMNERRLRQVDFYRKLELTPDRYVQGGDVICFTDFLISITQTREVSWKVLNRNTINLKQAWGLSGEDRTEAINPKDEWNITLEKIPKTRKVFFGLISLHETSFHFQIYNKFHHHPEDVGTWKVPLKEKGNVLSMRLEMLWDTVFANRLRKTVPAKK